jgi:hypothetical protein
MDLGFLQASRIRAGHDVDGNGNIFSTDGTVSAEFRPEQGSRSRIDRGIRYLAEGDEIIVLCWIEAKGSVSMLRRKRLNSRPFEPARHRHDRRLI